MNKTIALKEYNKRGETPLDMTEFDLIEGMKSYSSDKISGAFASLTGRELGLKDVELLILIIELSAVLTPPVQIIRGEDFKWPPLGTPPHHPYRSTFGSSEILCKA